MSFSTCCSCNRVFNNNVLDDLICATNYRRSVCHYGQNIMVCALCMKKCVRRKIFLFTHQKLILFFVTQKMRYRYTIFPNEKGGLEGEGFVGRGRKRGGGGCMNKENLKRVFCTNTSNNL